MNIEKKKVLFVASISGHISAFHMPYLKMFKEKGWKTSIAARDTECVDKYCDNKYKISISRSPFKLKNIRAIKQLRNIIKKERFDIIHCHTPMGSIVTRIAARNERKKGVRVIYTAHGFHFYKGAPLINWILFYPVEWYLAKYTDTLITINEEDYNLARKKFHKRCHDIQYVPGVGIDIKKFDSKLSKEEINRIRASLGLKSKDYVLIFPARLDKNKNQGFLIDCISTLHQKGIEAHLLLPGGDNYNGKWQKYTESLNICSNVHFLGYRDDIPKLLQISDLAVSSSQREGLPVNILEAAAVGLPIISLKCRGVEDIIRGKTSCSIVNLGDKDKFIYEIQQKTKSKSPNKPYLDRKFTLNAVIQKMNTIYFEKKRNA